jgi:hypothetical protein
MTLSVRWLLLLSLAVACAAAQQPADEIPDPKPGPAQPIPYSHKTHLKLGLKCAGCHTNPDSGQNMGIPESGRCMACHASIGKDQPAIRQLTSFYKDKQPIPWVRVCSISSTIIWSHRDHQKAGLTCNLCHGDVAQLDVMTRLMNVTTMDGCVGCHKDNHADASCGVCHEGK